MSSDEYCSTTSSISECVEMSSSDEESESEELESHPPPTWNKKIEKIGQQKRRSSKQDDDVKMMTALQMFELMFSTRVLNTIIRHTNANASQKGVTLDLGLEEFKNFLGLHILMGAHGLPTLSDYWSGPGDAFFSPYYATVMSGDRFFLIHKMLHFSADKPSNSDDKFHKVRYLLKTIIPKWSKINKPDKCLAIDKSTITTRENPQPALIFDKNEKNSFGIRTYTLLDPQSRYIHNLELHSGDSNQSPDDYVNSLTAPYKHKGHWVAFYNFHPTYSLFDNMQRNGFHCVGETLRNGKDIPDGKLKKFATLYHQSEQKVHHIRFRDSGYVRLYSTLPYGEQYVSAYRRVAYGMTAKKTPIKMPIQVQMYYKFMRGKDAMDRIGSRACESLGSKRWNLKVFNYLLEISIFNIYTVQKKSDKDIGRYCDFRSELATQITGRDPKDTVGAHYPSKYIKSKRCAHCSSTSECVRTTYGCSTCHVYLCVVPCFGEYHRNRDAFVVTRSPVLSEKSKRKLSASTKVTKVKRKHTL